MKKIFFIIFCIITSIIVVSCESAPKQDKLSKSSSINQKEDNSEEKLETKKEVIGISVSYTGDTKEGTILDKNNKGIKVYIKYDDNSKEEVSGWKITKPATLQAEKTSDITVEYSINNQTYFEPLSVTCTTEISLEQFKAECKSIPYQELARNPDNYKDSKIICTGEIIQIVQGEGVLSNYVNMRINITRGDYGIWNDTVYVIYKYKDGESKFLEDDIVNLYGTYTGLYSYKSVLGGTVTIPGINAKHIELAQ